MRAAGPHSTVLVLQVLLSSVVRLQFFRISQRPEPTSQSPPLTSYARGLPLERLSWMTASRGAVDPFVAKRGGDGPAPWSQTLKGTARSVWRIRALALSAPRCS